MKEHRCDIMYSLSLHALQALNITDHEAGDKPYRVTEPNTLTHGAAGRRRFFCSIQHLLLWAQAAVRA